MEKLAKITVSYGEEIVEFDDLGVSIPQEAKQAIEDKNFDMLKKYVTKNVTLVQIGNIHIKLQRVYKILEEHPEEVTIEVLTN